MAIRAPDGANNIHLYFLVFLVVVLLNGNSTYSFVCGVVGAVPRATAIARMLILQLIV